MLGTRSAHDVARGFADAITNQRFHEASTFVCQSERADAGLDKLEKGARKHHLTLSATLHGGTHVDGDTATQAVTIASHGGKSGNRTMKFSMQIRKVDGEWCAKTLSPKGSSPAPSGSDGTTHVGGSHDAGAAHIAHTFVSAVNGHDTSGAAALFCSGEIPKFLKELMSSDPHITITDTQHQNDGRTTYKLSVHAADKQGYGKITIKGSGGDKQPCINGSMLMTN